MLTAYVARIFLLDIAAIDTFLTTELSIPASPKGVRGLGWGRVARGNRQSPGYLLVEVRAHLPLPEQEASTAATCGQVHRRLPAGVRGCVDRGAGLQQMLQTVRLQGEGSSSVPPAFVQSHPVLRLKAFHLCGRRAQGSVNRHPRQRSQESRHREG